MSHGASNDVAAENEEDREDISGLCQLVQKVRKGAIDDLEHRMWPFCCHPRALRCVSAPVALRTAFLGLRQPFPAWERAMVICSSSQKSPTIWQQGRLLGVR